MKPEPSDEDLEVLCNDIGADFPDNWQTAAVEGTVALIRTRCKFLSSERTDNLRTIRHNISKFYNGQQDLDKEPYTRAYEYIMEKLDAELSRRPSLDDL